LAAALLDAGHARGRVLLARALVARDALPDALREAGFTVDVIPVYETRAVSEPAKAALRELFAGGKADAILFTSSSTVTETLSALGSHAVTLLAGVTVASIGPITTGTLLAASVRVDVTADVYTVEGLLDALQRHYSTKPANAPSASQSR
jgi:uroporphyrinogen III methyltransferase/synthase